MSAHSPASKVVLLIHQKSATRRLLTSILSAHGHQVVGAADAKTGLHGLVEHHPDVALVDASAVDANGVPLCQRIRQCCPIPIMLIAADSELASTTMLAMNCADAVILWPEPPEVLLATLDTLLGATRSLQLASDGRSKRADGTTIIVDPHQRRIFVHGAVIKLTAREYHLLNFLLHHRGRILTTRQIIDHVWGWEFEDRASAVHTYIWRLRRKIEPDPEHPTLLLNDYGDGYCLSHN